MIHFSSQFSHLLHLLCGCQAIARLHAVELANGMVTLSEFELSSARSVGALIKSRIQTDPNAKEQHRLNEEKIEALDTKVQKCKRDARLRVGYLNDGDDELAEGYDEAWEDLLNKSEVMMKASAEDMGVEIPPKPTALTPEEIALKLRDQLPKTIPSAPTSPVLTKQEALKQREIEIAHAR